MPRNKSTSPDSLWDARWRHNREISDLIWNRRKRPIPSQQNQPGSDLEAPPEFLRKIKPPRMGEE